MNKKIEKDEFVRLVLDRQRKRKLEEKEKERQAIKQYLNPLGYIYKVQGIKDIGAYKNKKKLSGYPTKNFFAN